LVAAGISFLKGQHMSKGDKWAEKPGKMKVTPGPHKNSNYGSVAGTKPAPAKRDIADKIERVANDRSGKLGC
jgi:hypothetical protein